MPGTDGPSLLEVAVGRAGVIAGVRAVEVVTLWAIAERQLGHELGQGEGLTAAVREYAAYWERSERTGWRHLDRFRAAFPEDESPARLAGWLSSRVPVGRSVGEAVAAAGSMRLAV
jgi:hypothetical protein